MSEYSPSSVKSTPPSGGTSSDSESTVRHEVQNNERLDEIATPPTVPAWVKELLPTAGCFEGLKPEYHLKSYEYVHRAAGTMPRDRPRMEKAQDSASNALSLRASSHPGPPQPLEPEPTMNGPVLPWPWNIHIPERFCVNGVNTLGNDEDSVYIIDLGDLIRNRIETASANAQNQANHRETQSE